MSFKDSVRVCLSKYADFSGRARRSEYWWFIVFTAVVTTVGSVIDAIVGTQWGHYGLFQALAALAFLPPSLAVGARRLHDRGKSGWLLVLLLIPVIGALVLVVFFFILDSEPDNLYGPAPKNVASVS